MDILLTSVLVLSLVGVVLIARPPFIFGSGGPEVPSAGGTSPTRDVTPEQRLIAVGYAFPMTLNLTTC